MRACTSTPTSSPPAAPALLLPTPAHTLLEPPPPDCAFHRRTPAIGSPAHAVPPFPDVLWPSPPPKKRHTNKATPTQTRCTPQRAPSPTHHDAGPPRREPPRPADLAAGPVGQDERQRHEPPRHHKVEDGLGHGRAGHGWHGCEAQLRQACVDGRDGETGGGGR